MRLSGKKFGPVRGNRWVFVGVHGLQFPPMGAPCIRYDISRPTGYKWVQRWPHDLTGSCSLWLAAPPCHVVAGAMSSNRFSSVRSAAQSGLVNARLYV